MRTSYRIILLALPLLAAACAPATAPAARDAAPETILVVENQSPVQVTIYVLREAHRERLGTAASLGTTRLRIPSHVLFGPTPLRFEISPLASREAPISQQITVVPGEEVTLRIPPTLR
jgi:hypothetical protein